MNLSPEEMNELLTLLVGPDGELPVGEVGVGDFPPLHVGIEKAGAFVNKPLSARTAWLVRKFLGLKVPA